MLVLVVRVVGYRFEKLIAWQKAMDFCEVVYEATNRFPREELYGITSQLRRATTSIPLNIAEGSACPTKKDFIKFLYYALRSQYEVVTILKLSRRLKYLNQSTHNTLMGKVGEVGKLIQGLINSLKEKLSTNN